MEMISARFKEFNILGLLLLAFLGYAATLEKPTDPKMINITEEFLNTEFEIKNKREEISPQVMARFMSFDTNRRQSNRKDPLTPAYSQVPIANPGERFNEGDIFNSNLSWAQLVFAGESKTMAFVVYLKGGFNGPEQGCTIFQLDNNKVIGECRFDIGGNRRKNAKVS